MPIKKKDGTAYKLRGPNPLMRNQDFWDDFVPHNMVFPSVEIQDRTVVIPVRTDLQPRAKSFAEELAETKEPEPLQSEEPKKEPETKEPEPPEEPKKPNYTKVVSHCLPALMREHRDEMYGEVRRTVSYGDPFTFEAVILETGDLSIQFWTNVDKVSKGSIIYPKTMDKRWWKVTERATKGGGWVITGVISEYQPHF